MRKTVMLLVTMGLPAAVGAQQMPTLTLEDALGIARESNPVLRRAELGVQNQRWSLRGAWGQMLPSLSASAGWSGRSSTTTQGNDDFGGVITSTERTIESSSASQGLSSNVTLFDGFRNLNRIREARASLAAADAGVDQTVLQTEADVARQFYNALRANRLVEVEQTLLSSAEERLLRQRELFRVVRARQEDVLTAELEIARNEGTLALQQGEARRARVTLLQTLGVLNEVEDFTPDGVFPEVFDPTGLVADDLVEIAATTHPQLLQARFQTAASERRVKIANGSWLPSISANGGWSRSAGSSGFGSVFDFNPRDSRGWSFGFNVSLPVFDGLNREQQIGQARAGFEMQQETEREAALQVEQTVRAALIGLQSAYAQYSTQLRAQDVAQRRLELAQERYRNGDMDYIDLQRFIDDAAQQERDLVERRYGFAIALVDLEQRVGQPIGN